MNEIELSAGPVEYTDSGGDGPVVVLLHGLMTDASLWEEVIAGLSAGHRCLAPTLPPGAHRRAMKPDADLSPPGLARLVEEFPGQLGLADVTLVGNDTGGALVQLLMADGTPRVSRAVLDLLRRVRQLPAQPHRPDAGGRGQTGLLPHADLAEIDDSYALIPLDQPTQLTRLLRNFLTTPLRQATASRTNGWHSLTARLGRG